MEPPEIDRRSPLTPLRPRPPADRLLGHGLRWLVLIGAMAGIAVISARSGAHPTTPAPAIASEPTEPREAGLGNAPPVVAASGEVPAENGPVLVLASTPAGAIATFERRDGPPEVCRTPCEVPLRPEELAPGQVVTTSFSADGYHDLELTRRVSGHQNRLAINALLSPRKGALARN